MVMQNPSAKAAVMPTGSTGKEVEKEHKSEITATISDRRTLKKPQSLHIPIY